MLRELDLELNQHIQPFRPVVADLDLDGSLEIAAGHRVFDSNGDVLFEAAVEPNWNGSQHQVQVVQADADPEAEVLFHGHNEVWVSMLHDTDGSVLSWYEESNPSLGYATPCGGDIDGDGITEIVRPSSRVGWSAYELDGTQLWVTFVPNEMGLAGCTLGDIDGDGALEVLITGGGATILDALTGQGLINMVEVGYGLQWGGGALVDLDGDGSTEAIVGGNNYAHDNSTGGVIVLSHVGGAWAPGAPSWPTSSHTAGAFDAMAGCCCLRQDGGRTTLHIPECDT